LGDVVILDIAQMRKSLPSRLLLFLCVVSLTFGFVPSVFAAQLTLTSLTNVAGLIFVKPSTDETIEQSTIISYDFSGEDSQSLTLIPDPIDAPTTELLSQDILETPTPTTESLPTLSPTPDDPSVTPSPTVSETKLATKVSVIPSPSPTITPSPAPLKLTPTVTPTPMALPTPTAIPTIAPVSAPSDLEPLFAKYGDEYHVDHDLLKRIAKCESSFNTNAVYGDYRGMFQFATSSWSVTRSAMGMDTNPDLRTNAEESIRTAAYKISQNGSGAWPNC
jgi:hypothetical protein